MNVAYNILVVIAVLLAIAFSLLVLITGKGDAMNGGGSVRTTFKGKASFDDIMSKWTLWFGVGFMGLVLVIDVISKQLATSVPVIDREVDVTPPTNAPVSASLPAANVPVTPTANVPVTDAPVGNAPATSSAPTNAAGSFLTPPSSSQPSVVPSAPVSSESTAPTAGTTTGGAANAAPPVGNR